ncbi:Biofilm PGA synthesis auxiliary protein PgaD, partial [Burkholderia sp. LMG 13014]
MKNAPIIDLSLRAPRDMIAERGRIVGLVMVVWFRLVRPALVGAVWASICIYTYRYLLPFNPAEMPIEQMVFYATSIAIIAGTIVTWLIAGRVVHPLAYRLRVSKMLRRSASAKV